MIQKEGKERSNRTVFRPNNINYYKFEISCLAPISKYEQECSAKVIRVINYMFMVH